MEKICIPFYKRRKFDSLQEAVTYLKKNSYSWYIYLQDIVAYTLRYRDYLRENGIDATIQLLIDEVPELKEEAKALDWLREYYTDEEVASYDIRCYDIRDKITVLGHEFKGLKDVIAHSSMAGVNHYSDVTVYERTPRKRKNGIAVVELYEHYPVFDSYDMGDDRTYQNYFFINGDVSAEDVEKRAKLSDGVNYCMVHEDLPEEMLPVLHYNGDGDYMLLAQKK